MSDALTGLLRELELLVEPLRRAGTSEQLRRRLFAALGWELDAIGGFPAQRLVDDAAQIAQTATALAHAADSPPDDLAAYAQVLQSIGGLFGAIDDLSQLAQDPGLTAGAEVSAALADIGEGLTHVLLFEYLRRGHPLAFELGRSLTLVAGPDDLADPTTTDLEGSDGTPVRFAVVAPAIQPQRFSDLLTDPVGALRAAYVRGDSLATPEGATAVAGRIFGRLTTLFGVMGAQVTDGWDLAVSRTGDAARTLVVRFPSIDDPVALGVVLEMLSAAEGGPGLSVEPTGWITQTWTTRGWQIGVELTGEIGAFVVGPGGVVVEGAVQAALELTLERRGDAGQPAVVVGPPQGTRLELGGIRIGAGVSFANGKLAPKLSLEIDDARLVVAAGDGDGFLQQVLPPDGAAAPFSLAFDWSAANGLTVRDNVGLQATLPVHFAVAGLEVDALEFGIDSSPSGLTVGLGASASLQLGPFAATVDGVGIRIASTPRGVGGNLGVLDASLGFQPPKGIGLSVDAAGCSGSGYLFADPAQHQYAGAVHLEFEGLTLNAVGLLTTQLPDGSPGFSLLIVISAAGFTPLQLGFGFTLTGVGGIVGVQRTIAVDVLRAKLTSGELDPVLFLDGDPVPRAPEIVRTLQTVFPPARGRYAFGPTAKLAWGTPTIFTIDLALVLEVPAPVRLVLLGRLRSVLPTEQEKLVELHMDVLGVVDFGRCEVAVDARLHDSRLVGFVLSGAMALRASWGDQPNLLLSIGGFNPRFAAPPAFPKLERLTIALASGDNPRLRLQAYVAVTSNTLQLGARLDFYVGVAGFSLSGLFSFDGLVQFSPFSFTVDVCASLALKAGDTTLMAISVQMTLSGPAPWHVKGSASFSILFFSITISFDATFGAGAPAPQLPPVDVWTVLQAELAKPAAWDATLPDGRRIVRLRQAGDGQGLLAHPLATLGVTQRLVPLDRTIEVYGNAPVAQTRSFSVAQVTLGAAAPAFGPTYAEFAPAQFRRLDDDEKVAAPSFDRMPAGVSLAPPPSAYGTALDAVVAFDTTVVARDGTRTELPQPTPLPAPVAVATAPTGAAGQSAGGRTGRRRYLGDDPPLVTVGPRRFAVADRSTLAPVPGASGVDDSWSASVDAVDRLGQPVRPSAQVVHAEEVLA